MSRVIEFNVEDVVLIKLRNMFFGVIFRKIFILYLFCTGLLSKEI